MPANSIAAGNGPFPAVVLLPPCSGRLPPRLEQADAARYTALGYVLLAVDSFGARGIADGCTGGGASVDMVMDAYGALLHLADLPFVDPDRIALVGYSFGGSVALSAVGIRRTGAAVRSPVHDRHRLLSVLSRTRGGWRSDRDPDR